MKKITIEGVAFYLFSLVCICGCFWLHAIKTEQAADLMFSEEAEQEQKDVWYDEETDNEIGTDLNAQLKEMENELGEIEEKTQRLQMQYRLLTLL